ncbi:MULTISPECIES: 5'-nucleotidase C-terminal domain-containing protein [unclassified Granulicatella]|uniref:5'-nucleotidase C-terminal domain-containing protein n=1 Tax=unclassified Granulicatella TaxID=2630493 RepID=UPI001073E83A|nr:MULTISPECIES: 5'-nucleotidase C-terminal domain-containing protein [unclassified Granulicatella]MBF0780103.1 5'-nucleotidase C-terminal domain-containing protein [Granulicatella sp. 19428wC4_WM01]TFU95829.1 LPXTG cell wall anchor domain-containing protein [Granulicatella sp. WM01]
MNKKTYLASFVSTVLLSPMILANHAFAETNAPNAPASAEITPNETIANSTPTTEETSSTVNDAPTPSNTENPNSVGNSSASKEKDIVILHTNDMHGRLEEDKRGKVIGVAKLDAIVKEERAKDTQTTLLVDAGDALQGLPISNSSKGEDMAKILNEIGYDAVAVGNHEFDFGFDQAVKYKEIFTFPLLSANTYVNGVRLFDASTIIDKDKNVIGDEVVVIGVTTPETYTKTHPKNIKNVEFRDPITEVKNVITEVESRAKAEGKEYNTYVIIGHLGIDDTTKKEWQGSTLADELSKFKLLENKKVVMIDGHSHTAHSTTYGKNVVYNQTGNYLNNIGKVTLGGNGTMTPTLISYKDAEKITPSSNIAEKVAEIKEKFKQENATIIVENNTVELNGNRMNVRVRETNLGNVVADALYDYGQTGFKNKSDLAVTNGGGLRDTIKKDAPITRGDIIAVLPFGNTISQIEVKGAQILDMFKHSLSAVLQKDKEGNKVLDERGLPLLEANGSFLHVSGVKVYHDTTLDPEKRVLRVDIFDRETGQYVPLDLEKTYYLTTNDFLAAGGDGYTMLGGAREEGPSMDTVFADFLKHTNLAPYGDVNPNQRIISLTQADFEAMTKQEEPKITPVQDDDNKSDSDKNKNPEQDNNKDNDGQSDSDKNKNPKQDDNKSDSDKNKNPKNDDTDSNSTKPEKNNTKTLPYTGTTEQSLSILGAISLALGAWVIKYKKALRKK